MFLSMALTLTSSSSEVQCFFCAYEVLTLNKNSLGYSQYYPSMIDTLRANFESDPDNTYYITGAPQCPIPEPNSTWYFNIALLIWDLLTIEDLIFKNTVGIIIENAVFDYLFVQFYNNNNYVCH